MHDMEYILSNEIKFSIIYGEPWQLSRYSAGLRAGRSGF
jgi:hypothetical protein